MGTIAILIDGGFFKKLYGKNYGKCPATDLAQKTVEYALGHLDSDPKIAIEKLYRIFYYDCPPTNYEGHYPVSKKAIKFIHTPAAKYQQNFLEALKSKRKVALRLGELHCRNWSIRPPVIKDILAKKRTVDSLTDDDFMLDLEQKGVDMRMGVDIAALAYKKLVTQIILISGDSDFVPAAKLARREGIDFVLDHMNNPIKPLLNEHVDGIFRRILP